MNRLLSFLNRDQKGGLDVSTNTLALNNDLALENAKRKYAEYEKPQSPAYMTSEMFFNRLSWGTFKIAMEERFDRAKRAIPSYEELGKTLSPLKESIIKIEEGYSEIKYRATAKIKEDYVKIKSTYAQHRTDVHMRAITKQALKDFEKVLVRHGKHNDIPIPFDGPLI